MHCHSLVSAAASCGGKNSKLTLGAVIVSGPPSPAAIGDGVVRRPRRRPEADRERIARHPDGLGRDESRRAVPAGKLGALGGAHVCPPVTTENTVDRH